MFDATACWLATGSLNWIPFCACNGQVNSFGIDTGSKSSMQTCAMVVWPHLFGLQIFKMLPFCFRLLLWIRPIVKYHTIFLSITTSLDLHNGNRVDLIFALSMMWHTSFPKIHDIHFSFFRMRITEIIIRLTICLFSKLPPCYIFSDL